MEVIADTEGRFIILTLEIDNRYTITLVNIYGPNIDDPEWFLTLFKKVSQLECNSLIMAGDWNIALKENDYYNYKTHRNIKSCEIVSKHIFNTNLIDIWRLQNDGEKRFTWGTKKNFKRARLDYFLISEDLLNLNPESDILSAYKSDHNMIKLNLKTSSNVCGKGNWKLNNEILKHRELITLIKQEIKLAKETYALPIYNPDTIHQVDEMKLELMISDSLFLNTLLCQIRGVIISYSKRKARESRKEEKELAVKIDKLTKILDNVNLEQEIRDLKITNLNTLNKQYQKCQRTKNEGSSSTVKS